MDGADTGISPRAGCIEPPPGTDNGLEGNTGGDGMSYVSGEFMSDEASDDKVNDDHRAGTCHVDWRLII